MFCLEIQEFLVGGCPRYEIATPFFTNELTFERHDRVLLNAEFQEGKLRLSCDYSSSTFNIEVVSEALKRDRTIGKARVLVEIRFVPKFRSGYISNNIRPVALLVDIRRFSCKTFPSDTDEIQRFSIRTALYGEYFPTTIPARFSNFITEAIATHEQNLKESHFPLDYGQIP